MVVMRAAWADRAVFMRARALGRVRRAVAITVIGGAAVCALPVVAGAAPVQPYGGGSHYESDSTQAGVTDPPVADPGDPGDPATLPFTGGDVAGLAVIGAAAIGAGIVATRVRRNAASRA
jgi:hypothetical protein